MLTGVYAAGRDIQILLDRKQHQQSIGLDSAVSRNCWLGIGGVVMCIVSVGTLLAAVTTAQEASAMSAAGKFAMQSVAVSSRVLKYLAVTNAFVNIIGKIRNEKDITPLNVFQVTSAVLFSTLSDLFNNKAMFVIKSMEKYKYINMWRIYP
jgi:TRAP-type mannitol/chloroaromatic compound transport system permease large subunit